LANQRSFQLIFLAEDFDVFVFLIICLIGRGRRVRDSMVVGFTTTGTKAISAYHRLNCELESRSWRGVLDLTLYDKVR